MIELSDAEILLSHVLKKPRSWLLAHPEIKLTEEQKALFEIFVKRRKNHEPVAYILGEKEFYGRKFYVDNRVLIPRPATETLIDEVKKIWRGEIHPSPTPHITPADADIVIFSFLKKSNKLPATSYKLIDVGTGSGCIGITLALELPEAEVICTDISEDALNVARENAKRHQVLDRVMFVEADGFPSDVLHLRHGTTHYLLVSNPPYIPSNTILPPDVANFEPHKALFSGIDGMDVLSQIFRQSLQNTACTGCILECRKEQAEALANELRSQKYLSMIP